jgi:hypothetical protein
MADRPRLLRLQLLGQLRCVQETLGILKELLQRAAIGTSVGFESPKTASCCCLNPARTINYLGLNRA